MSYEKLDVSSLWENPLCAPADLGTLIPPVPHGISACLPEWQDNIDYEKRERRVMDALEGGYPRFVFPEASQQLFDTILDHFGQPGEQCHVYPSQAAADRCAAFIDAYATCRSRVLETGHDTWSVFFNAEGFDAAKSYWTHSGEGTLSRQAAAILENRPAVDATDSLNRIKERVAGIHNVAPENVYIFPTGMTAIWTVMRFFRQHRPGTETIQFGFPYVDTLKLQERTGSGHRFFPLGNAEDIDRVKQLVSRETYCSLFCEAPSNPLLITPNIPELSGILRSTSTPFIIDDTLAACGNLELLPHCDVVATSLTKYFSGIGDVMGGALVINPESPWNDALEDFLAADDYSPIWCEDLLQLDVNSRDTNQRVGHINCNAEALADYLYNHPAVRTVYYPKYTNAEEYDCIRRPGGGYGGLLSFTLKQEKRAVEVYDDLALCKGPNLGMEYTLVCPFTILAHYHELAFVERCGLSPWLIRVSVGLEPTDELIGRFDDALSMLR